jgi:hypothetical protein
LVKKLNEKIMKKLLLICLLGVFAFASCYEDKGNYEYSQALLIEGNNGVSGVYPKNNAAIIGERYTFYPPLTYKYYTHPDDTLDENLEYTWVCASNTTMFMDTLCVGKVLDWVCDRMIDYLNVYLHVKEKKSGVEYRFLLQLYPQSKVSKGYAFLHNYGGKTDMSFVRPYWESVPDPTDPASKINTRFYELNKDFLSRANPNGVGTNPKTMCWYGNDEEARIVLIQDESYTIDGATWKHDMDLRSEFAGGFPTSPVKDHFFISGASFIHTEDGRVYRRENYNGSQAQGEYIEFYPQAYPNVPLMQVDNGQDLIIEKFLPQSTAWLGNCFCAYDKINGRMLYTPGGSGNRNTGNMFYPPIEMAKLKENQFKTEADMQMYVDLANMGDWEMVIGGDMGISDGENKSNQLFLLKNKTTGEMRVEMVRVSQIDSYTDPQYSPVYDNIQVRKWPEGVQGATADMINENTVYYFLEGRKAANQMFFAKDNKLYCWDFDVHQIYLYYEFPAGVYARFLYPNPQETELGVYSSDNVFRTFDITTAQLNNPDFSKKIIGEITGLTDVVAMKYFYPTMVIGYSIMKED